MILISSTLNHTSNANIMPFLLIGVLLLLSLFVYYKLTKITKFDTFSFHCAKCGRLTNGLKCGYCQIKKL